MAAVKRNLTPWMWGSAESGSPGSTASAAGPCSSPASSGMPVSLAAGGFSFAALENEPEGATSTTVGEIVTVLRGDRMLDEEPAA